MNLSSCIEKYEKLVKRVLARRIWGPDKSPVDDLSQEVWIKLMKIENIPNDPAFIKTIANNTATDYWRRNKNKIKAVSLTIYGTNISDRRAAQLPTEIKLTPLLQMRAEGWFYKDIATHLGVPIGTVKSRIHKERNKLRF